jgi:PAS domain S-box-containing protein
MTDRYQQLYHAYEKLKKSKEYYESLLEFSSIGFLTLDIKNRILDINNTGARLLGKIKGDLIGKNFLPFISSDNENTFNRYRTRCLESGQIQALELQLNSEGVYPRHVKLEGISNSENSKNQGQIRIAIIDVTDQKKADERIKALSQELLRSQETERRMIARELHDSVAQELSAVKMGYDSLLDSHSEITQDIRQRTQVLSKTLQETIRVVRDLSYDLRPPGLEKAGIIQCLFNFCSEFSDKFNVGVDFFSVGMEAIELDDFTEINIYRLVQEGLNNVNKHAQASHVDVMFSFTHPDIMLRITDNGIGFDVEKRLMEITSEKRMGLRSMEERVTLLGGTISVQSMPLHGTKIIIKLPYGKDFHG